MLNKILTPLVNVFAPPKNPPGEHVAAFDFETYSSAGYVWDDKKEKYKALPGTDKLGLKAVGSAIYSEHPETEVLSMAYDLHLGAGPKLWKPGDLPPIDLFEYLANGGLLEAWNVTFERWIWQNVCRPKYGWPALPNEQLRDAMAKARAYALPGGLEKCGNVLEIQNKKDKRGEQLIDKFCKPRNPTKLNPSRRTLLQQDPPNAALFAQYNLTDIKAESEISERVPDLSPDELEFWQCDQKINSRGVQVDTENVKNCIAIIEQAYEKYNAELHALTGGQVNEASKVAQLLKWINSRGVNMKKLTKETVPAMLKDATLPSNVRRILEIRQALGSAAVKKLYALQVQTARDGRVHDLFIYHSARTGRAAGAGPQPQNFPKGGPDVIKCLKCSRHCQLFKITCPWCGNQVPLGSDGVGAGFKRVEWNAAAVEDAIYTIRTGSLEFVEAIWGDAIKVVSGCLRGLFIAAKHHRLICSDYSAIEAVVLAALAGEEWRMEVFRTHGKIYEMSASKISGVPFSEFERHKKETESHHPLRNKLGKIAELACLGPDTQVLTTRGYVAIVDIRQTDKLWDGVEWVNHQGVINKGQKKVFSLDGVKMTPDHPVSLNGSWKEARLLALNVGTLYQALEVGSANLPSSKTKNKKQLTEIESLPVDVLAGHSHGPRIQTYDPGVQNVVTLAPKKLRSLLALNGSSITGIMKTLYQTSKIVGVCAVEFLPRSVDAIIQKIQPSLTMAHAGFTYATNGEKVGENFSNTLRPSKGGMIKCWKWIESIVTKAMNRETFGLFRGKIINSINEKCTNSNNESPSLSLVYDIVNAGPRNRFTIKTKSGHLIVHNSGYQGWVGAWKSALQNIPGDKFFENDEQIKKAVSAWRDANPMIVALWYGLEKAAISAVRSPGKEFKYRDITYIREGNVLRCRLPSGRYLSYHDVKLKPGVKYDKPTVNISFKTWNTNPKYGAVGWVEVETYGGKLTENVVQAASRDILAHAIVQLEQKNYPVVLHVHDEIVAEVPIVSRHSVGEFEEIMVDVPTWASTWPIRARDGWQGHRYRK